MTRTPENRITVNLSDDALAALERAIERKQRKKTGIVNQALIRNDFFEEHMPRGVYIVNEDGEMERIHLL